MVVLLVVSSMGVAVMRRRSLMTAIPAPSAVVSPSRATEP